MVPILQQISCDSGPMFMGFSSYIIWYNIFFYKFIYSFKRENAQ